MINTKSNGEYMLAAKNNIQKQIDKEFRSGYLYLSMAGNDSKNSKLAKEKIESGMEFFDKLMAVNQSSER